jgi:hypothetical protein
VTFATPARVTIVPSSRDRLAPRHRWSASSETNGAAATEVHRLHKAQEDAGEAKTPQRMLEKNNEQVAAIRKANPRRTG